MVEYQDPTRHIDATDLGEQHFDILLTPQDPPDRRGNVSRRQRRGGDLIQQRLEDVVIPAVEEGDLHVDTLKCTRRVQPSEPAPDDHHVHVTTILRADTVGLHAHCDSHGRDYGTYFARTRNMTIAHRITSWGGARLSRRVSRSLPLLGAAIAVVTVASTLRRKGVISGTLDTGLNAVPFVGAAKNLIEVVRRTRLFPGSLWAGSRTQALATLTVTLPPYLHLEQEKREKREKRAPKFFSVSALVSPLSPTLARSSVRVNVAVRKVFSAQPLAIQPRNKAPSFHLSPAIHDPPSVTPFPVNRPL